jgi:type IV pilus assembly protein PilE
MTWNKRGFTMVEIMVVLIIVSILAAMAIPNYNRSVERAKSRDAQTTLEAIYQSERLFQLDNQAFGTLGQLVAGNYIVDPDPGNSNLDWDYATAGVAATTFTVTATRTGGLLNGTTITINQAFGTTQTFGGTHDVSNI